MRSLLDVNVLIALLDADHALHLRAVEWLKSNATHGWASCPLTQNGCLRVMSGQGYPNPLPVSAIAERLGGAVSGAFHEFWADDVSILDTGLVDPHRIHGPRQVTDIYLLALAVHRDGRFVTFDRSVAADAVRDGRKHLHAI